MTMTMTMTSDKAAEEAEAEEAEEEQKKSGKKAPGTWTSLETMHLIDAYQEKWYALKRGQLRTCHWNEVAQSLADHDHHHDATHKTSMQCRHKLEKLRRRYRAERQLSLRKSSSRVSSSWPFFQRMDLLERGPATAAEAAVIAKGALTSSDLKRGNTRDQHDHNSIMSEDEDLEDSSPPLPPRVFSNRKRRHNHHNPLYDEDDASYSPFTRKRSAYDTAAFNKRDEHKNLRKVSEKTAGAGFRRLAEPAPSAEIVSVIRSLGEGLLQTEHMKLQVQRETEQFRAEMQMRRTEMVIDSQKQIADLFAKALVNCKKGKEPQPPHKQAGGQ